MRYIELLVLFIFGFIIGAGLRPMADALDGLAREANEYGSER